MEVERIEDGRAERRMLIKQVAGDGLVADGLKFTSWWFNSYKVPLFLQRNSIRSLRMDTSGMMNLQTLGHQPETWKCLKFSQCAVAKCSSSPSTSLSMQDGCPAKESTTKKA